MNTFNFKQIVTSDWLSTLADCRRAEIARNRQISKMFFNENEVFLPRFLSGGCNSKNFK